MLRSISWEGQPPEAGSVGQPAGALKVPSAARFAAIELRQTGAIERNDGTKTPGQRLMADSADPTGFILRHRATKGFTMLTFQIIGGIFVLLFLAGAMTGIEGAEGRE
jgi:hypothetical protein